MKKNLKEQLKRQIKKIISEQTEKRIGLGRNVADFDSENMEQVRKKLHELDQKYNDLKELIRKYGSGYYTYINTKDNKKYKVKLFVDARDTICIYLKNAKRTGLPVSSNSELIMFGTNFQPIKEKLLSKTEKLYNNIKKLKDLWTSNKVHPNLWQKEVALWKNLNMNDVKIKCMELQDVHDPAYQLWSWLGQKYKISTAMEYKTTTVNSWKPREGTDHRYESYKQNIKKHLSGREKFEYHWKSSYDISVYGDTVDGEYKAWFSLEYKNTGNGHYYLLLNENLAIFVEDD